MYTEKMTNLRLEDGWMDRQTERQTSSIYRPSVQCNPDNEYYADPSKAYTLSTAYTMHCLQSGMIVYNNTKFYMYVYQKDPNHLTVITFVPPRYLSKTWRDEFAWMPRRLSG